VREGQSDRVSEIRERVVPVNGIRLNVAQAGEGSPVLLLHGFPDRWQLWRHQIPVLAAAGYHVIAPDLRGFGESERPTEVADYRLATLLGDVTGLLDELGIERAAVVGHDWGGALAWSLALQAPERVDRLTSISVGHGATAASAGLRQRELSWYMLWFLFPGVAEQVLPREDWAFLRQWAWAGAPAGTDADADRQVADLSRPGALVAGLNWYRANVDPAGFVPSAARAVKARRVGCPTMGIWSSADFALGEDQMTASARFVDGPWRYERIEDVSHWVPVQSPDRLNELLLDFLSAAF